jgi:hypothetical protein
LERIAADDYDKHIQNIAIDTWDKRLEQDALNKIIELSNRHPYYVNYLCDSIWESCKKIPNVSDVERAWNRVVTEEWSDALRELSDLPLGQRRLLKFIANHQVKNIHSQEISTALSMPVSSISTAIRVLIEKDYVEQNENDEYNVINPLLLAVLQGVEV